MTAVDPVPSPLATVLTLASVTLKRLGRGKALWIAVLIAALPIMYAAVIHAQRHTIDPDDVLKFEMLLLGLLPPMFVAASIGEEIEDRTSTYLWSRPIPRWAVLAGKLLALAPIAMALLVGAYAVAVKVGGGDIPVQACIAIGVGGLAVSLIATGIATLLPKHGMALTISYMLVDGFIGVMPFSLREISITNQVRVLAGYGTTDSLATPVIALAVIAGLWAIVGFSRIRRLEV